MRFWNWKDEEETAELLLNGIIASESWWGDEVTPAEFRAEMKARAGKKIRVTINSPGGDVFAAAEIYSMLKEHEGGVETVIQSLAASAASVVAMAGEPCRISPVGMLMIHNPWTWVAGNEKDLAGVIRELREVKQSIIAAYQLKTGLDEEFLARMMDREEYINANRALELGFVDEIMFTEEQPEVAPAASWSNVSYREHIAAMLKPEKEPPREPSADEMKARKMRLELELRKRGF